MFKCISNNCHKVEERLGEHCLCEMPIDCQEVENVMWVKVNTYICSEICENCNIKSKDIINFGGEDNFTVCHTLCCSINKERLD